MTVGVNRAVFLDRDGVLNKAISTDGGGERPPWSLSELEITASAAPACAHLRAHGFLTVVVSNQPDIAYYRVDAAAVDDINRELVSQLALDAVYVCPHGSGSACHCRKPGPGMVLAAAANHSINLAASWLVGDRWVDIAAGRAAGVRTLLIESPISWDPTSAGRPPAGLVPDARAESLLDAAQIIAPDGPGVGA